MKPNSEPTNWISSFIRPGDVFPIFYCPIVCVNCSLYPGYPILVSSGASYRVVSRVFGMPRSTVHCIVHRLTEEVVAIRHKVIHLPKTPEDLEVVSRGFAGLARHRAFLRAAGAIDGCHIRIKPPVGPDGHCYRNRKLFPSIFLQAVCDHQGCLIDTYVGWPGSVHNSRVLHYSPLYRQSVYPPPRHFILRVNEGVAAQPFNSHHSRARSIIERAFGMMKTRFRAIFLQALEVHHTFVPHVSEHIVVTACAILHNICLCAGDTMPGLEATIKTELYISHFAM
uniref:DDE Tnp4 domain-containing protein n=1 Tax=Oryzias melastigma TaxID=30732 RepID=A0A3B3CKN0_ORYME